MNTGPKEKILDDDNSRRVTAEQRLTQLASSFQRRLSPSHLRGSGADRQHALSHRMLPTAGREAKFVGASARN